MKASSGNSMSVLVSAIIIIIIIIILIFYKEYSLRYTHTIKRWWPLRVAQSTNRHITLHKRTNSMANAKTRHRNADSPSSRR